MQQGVGQTPSVPEPPVASHDDDKPGPVVLWAIRGILALLILSALYLYAVRNDHLAVEVFETMKNALCL